ncbi:hypothetical protein GW17_00017915 [Ensete ventricosum]|nr:hypothetical protein GW17_00017915 [Ensete ventricosum]
MSQKCWRDGYKHFAKMCSKMKGQFKISKKGKMSALSRNMNARHMSKVLPPPQMLKQIGGMGGLQNFMKQMGFKDMGGSYPPLFPVGTQAQPLSRSLFSPRNTRSRIIPRRIARLTQISTYSFVLRGPIELSPGCVCRTIFTHPRRESEWIRLECIEDEEEEPKRIGFPPLTPYSFKSCSSETEEGESKVEEGKGRVMRVSSRVAPKRDGDAPAGQDRRRAALQV